MRDWMKGLVERARRRGSWIYPFLFFLRVLGEKRLEPTSPHHHKHFSLSLFFSLPFLFSPPLGKQWEKKSARGKIKKGEVAVWGGFQAFSWTQKMSAFLFPHICSVAFFQLAFVQIGKGILKSFLKFFLFFGEKK
jgi:hypothetical protein